MSSDTIRVMIHDTIREEMVEWGLSRSALIRDLVDAIVKGHKLPRFDFEEGPLSYQLWQQEGNIQLDKKRRLQDYPVKAGDVLVLESKDAGLIWKLIEEIRDNIIEEIVEKAWDKVAEMWDRILKTGCRDERVQEIQAMLEQYKAPADLINRIHEISAQMDAYGGKGGDGGKSSTRRAASRGGVGRTVGRVIMGMLALGLAAGVGILILRWATGSGGPPTGGGSSGGSSGGSGREVTEEPVGEGFVEIESPGDGQEFSEWEGLELAAILIDFADENTQIDWRIEGPEVDAFLGTTDDGESLFIEEIPCEGEYYISAAAYDPARDEVYGGGVTIFIYAEEERPSRCIDEIPIFVEIISPEPDGQYAENELIIFEAYIGDGEPQFPVYWYVDELEAGVWGEGLYVETELSQGPHTILVRYGDAEDRVDINVLAVVE